MKSRRDLMQDLHGLAAARGLSHEDLRAVCGVESLTHATDQQLAAACARLGESRPNGVGSASSRSRRRRPSEPRTLRLISGPQKTFIQSLLRDLGWSPDWLWEHHRIRDIETAAIDTRRASSIINELTAAKRKDRVFSVSP